MKRKLMTFLVLALFSFVISACGLMSSGGGNGGDPVRENLIINWSFEDTSLDESADDEVWLTDDWSYREYAETTTFDIVDDVAKTGSRSLRIKGTGGTGNPRGTVRQAASLDDPTPGTTYRLSAWFKTEDIADPEAVDIRLTFKRGSTNISPWNDPNFELILLEDKFNHRAENAMIHVTPKTIDSGEWQQFEVILKSPSDSPNVLNVELFLWKSTGTIWWDDIVVERID